MFRSATAKLTLWYMAIVAAITLSFSIVIYQFASLQLSQSLSQQSQRWSDEFPAFTNDPFFRKHDELEIGRRNLLFNILYFDVVVLVAAGFASYWLAKRTLQPIEAAHEQQKRFTADVSHELRTPLTAIKMESEVALLDEKAGKSELRSVIQSNLEEVDRLNTLISNLLKLTRLEVQELQQDFKPLRLQTLIKASIDNVQKAADAKQISINDRTQDVSLSGDGESLIQLFGIILDNAIKYSPAGSAIAIDGHHDAGHVIVTIADQGMGIEPEALKHVFERFYRADKARTKDDASGFGLGLSIAKYIADLHNGTITITSRVKHGTKVTLSLPVKTDRP